jgi:endoglucanase
MHKRIAKAVTASLMAATMLTTTVATVIPMSVSAGNMLGESEFTKKGLPWHTCETSPAKQTFEIKDGQYVCTIKEPGGQAKGGESRWDLQFRHRKLKIQSGHTYKIHWEVDASTAGEMYTKIGDLSGDLEVWHNNASDFNQGWSCIPIKAGKNTFDSEFTATQTLEVAEWAFHYGGAGEWQPNDCFPAGTVLKFDNMKLECTSCPDAYSEGSCNWDPSDDFGIRSRKNSKLANNFISVNQVGYFTNLTKKATLGDNAGGGEDDLHTTLSSSPMEFQLLDSSGKAVYTGKTQPNSGVDKASGDNTHTLDFSDFKTEGTYTLKCGDYVSFPFEIGNDLYSKKGHDLLTNAMNYYYQNRSGISIEEKYITSRDDIKSSLAHVGGHNPDMAYVQPKWVKAYAGEFDGDKTYSIDGTGGWYDAGDHGKYVVNGGISVWTLQNIYERSIKLGDDKKFADGSGAVVVPEAGNGHPDILDETAVELDWMMKMVVSSADPAWGKYAGLVYHKLHDHKWTGLATKPYDYELQWGTTRIVKPPSFAATLNFVACAAQAARLWEPYDSAKASQYLEAAKTSYDAYMKHKYDYTPAEATNDTSLYAPMDQAIGGGAYGDTNVADDAYWAAAELFATTGDSKYYTDMKGYEHAFEVVTKIEGGENNGSWGSFNWGNTSSLGSISLYLNPEKVEATDAAKITSTLTAAADAYVEKENEQAYGIPYDTAQFSDPVNIGTDASGNPIIIDGYEWGSNSFVINNAIVMAYAYDVTKDASPFSSRRCCMIRLPRQNSNGGGR